MKNRLSNSFHTENVNETIRLQVITTDEVVKRISLPIDLLEHLVQEINEFGQVTVLFADNTYLMIKAIIFGSSEFWEQKRLIIINGDGS